MIPVILSGGSGTRLWPVSRVKFPKQFADLFDESLFSKTLRRLKSLGEPWSITTQDLRVLTDRAYSEAKIKSPGVIYEPFGRNTAAAIAALVRVMIQKGLSDEIVGIFPADHFIENEKEYLSALKLAEQVASGGSVVTIGILPTFPATGYGYIETTKDIKDSQGKLKAYKAVGFREKPSREKAEGFLKSGTYFWNAGMFIFKVGVMAQLFEKHQPKIWSTISELKNDLSNIGEVYKKVESISIDYAIMEKLSEHVCIPVNVGWSDVGSWDEVAKIKTSDTDVVEVGSKNNFVLSQDKKVYSFVDADDLMVIETSDAVLIAKRGSSQKVKDALEKIKSLEQGKKLVEERNFELRPWGRFEVLRDTEDFKSKVIQVEPGHQLSYQSHAKRAEHWVIVKGHPEVVLNDKVHHLKPGESIYIPQGAKHRMRNTTQEIVEFVEVQVGTYFGEDDIVRYQDDYKR